MCVLSTVLEVYQFARDAAVAEAWLIAQEPHLMSSELGHTIDEVENLIKKHEAFEKSAAAQEERFIALRRLTTVRHSSLFIVEMKFLIFCPDFFEQFELKEIKRRQDAAEEAERKRLQQEQDERAAAEAQAEAVRKAETRDSHDAPGSPKREAGNFEHNISTISHLCSKALDLLAGK